MNKSRRDCPLCSGTESRPAFPHSILFEDKLFRYYRCRVCKSVFVDPVPDEQTFLRIYAKAQYHDNHYSECSRKDYDVAASVLARFSPRHSIVLDYGCGLGHFLKAINQAGMRGYGVEFDDEAAKTAARAADCEVVSVVDFSRKPPLPLFDVIHLGDVLEHLPDPANTLQNLLRHLKPGGLLFVEGPLEINPSPVYWASLLFGTLKHFVRPNFSGRGRPTHLFRTDGRQQMAFFERFQPKLELLHWEIYETGWPYAGGGNIRSLIASVAMMVSGKKLGSVTFGNRFTSVFRVGEKG